jgi:hypothetical protein
VRKSIFLILLLGLGFMTSYRDDNLISAGEPEKNMSSQKLNKIGHETGLPFPSESKIIYFSEPDRFVDPVWVAKVIIPTSWYGNFKTALFEKTADNTVYHGALAGSTIWWKPMDVVLSKQYLADRQTFVNVVVSKEDGEFAVYIECAVF